MKVLHVLQSNRFSGAENVVCQIIAMFGDMPEIEMVYCSQDGQIREALTERNIKFAPMKKLCASEVKRVIAEEKPDVIHAHDMGASFFSALACGKTPLISHVHVNALNARKLNLKALAYYFAAKKAKHIFWVSDSSYNGYYFQKKLSSKSSILYNIIDIKALYEKAAKDTNTYDYDVVYLGRLTTQKNPQRLMQVMKKVVQKKPNVKIAVIGTGDLEAETKAVAGQLKLEENVSFLGFQSNPLKILKDAKVMVMTSRWEGTPMCALEAMALGVPIVTTPTDGLLAVVENEKTGFLSDDDDVLADSILKILEDRALYTKMSANSIQKAQEKMDTGTYKETILSFYQ